MKAGIIAVTKPGITAGVTLAGLAGMSLAAGGLPAPGRAALCLLCLLAAAAGSAVLNVLLERGTDALMTRTAWRGDAVGATGVHEAAVFATVLIASSSIASYIFIGPTTCALILAASVGYSLVYTLRLKRSPFGTVAGGIPGALPVLIGYSAIRPGLGFDGFILFTVMLLWQPPHFLALAMRHREEYERAGVPVMPAVLGEEFTRAFVFLYAAGLIPLTFSLSLFGYCSPNFGWFSLAAGTGFLVWYYIDLVRSRNYGRAFAASIGYIMMVLMAVVLDKAS